MMASIRGMNGCTSDCSPFHLSDNDIKSILNISILNKQPPTTARKSWCCESARHQKGGKGFVSKSMNWRGRFVRARTVFGDDPVRLSLCGDGICSALLLCFLPLICLGDEVGAGCVRRRDGAGLKFNGLDGLFA